MNTETSGTGRSSGCPPVPCGLWAVPGGSAPLPLPRADDRDHDQLQGSVGPPWCHVLGICSPAPSLRATAACPALGEAPSGPGYAVSQGGSAPVGRTLAGDPPGTQHHEPGTEPPAALGASCTGGAACTLPQKTGLRSCLCSRLVSGGQPREGRFHERGAPLSAPRMGLPRCPRGIWAGVASGDCLSFQWFLAVFCLEGRV